MLKDQIQKYEKIRQAFSDPSQAIIRQKTKEGLPFLSLNFPIVPELSKRITDIMKELEKIDPGHEHIPVSWLHCTVKSFGLVGNHISEEDIPGVINRVEEILRNFPSFEVELRGVNVLRPVLFIQVFSKDNKLFELHNLLKDAIPYSGYPQLEGEGYTPHVTAAYFAHKPDKLFSLLNNYKDIPIGKMRASRFEIIRGIPGGFLKRELIKSFKLTE